MEGLVADKQYATVVGFVQFPVEKRALPSGQEVRDVTVRPAGVDTPLVRGTLWPEFDSVEVGEGDLVAIDGEYTERTGQNREGGSVTYRNVNIKKLAVLSGAERAEREVVNSKGGGRKKSSF
jgi:hypothetical protein